MVFVDQVKSRKPDKRFSVTFNPRLCQNWKEQVSHLCLKSREHTYISCESHEQQSEDSINTDFIEKLMVFQTEVVPRSGSPLALPLKPDTACFSASKSLFMVQNSSVLYFCSPLSHCSVNVNVFKYSSQIPFVKNKTCYILAFICYIKLSYGIKQNLKDKEILRGLVFSSDCWL